MKEPKTIQNAEIASRLRLLTGLSIALVCLLLWIAGAVFGYAQAGGGAGRSLTTPPTRYEDGLITKPDPVDDTGNLLITGNVAGGKHFRGPVPYRSTTSIDAPLGSTQLDSFLRITEPVDLRDTSQTYEPFYSPSGTVATLQGGPDGRAVPAASSTGAGTPSLEMDRYQQQLHELQRRLAEIRAGVNALEHNVAIGDDKHGDVRPVEPQPSTGRAASLRESLLQETARLLSTTLEPVDAQSDEPTDAPLYRGTGLRLYDPQRDAQVTLDAALSAPRAPAVVPSIESAPERPLPEPTYARALPSAPETLLPVSTPAVTTSDHLLSLSESTVRSETPQPTVSRRDYEVALQKGQSYLTQGLYRRAAESFTTALAYNPNDAQTQLAKFQALFGAGEFSSGVTSLTCALELDPAAALRKADLITISGGPDAFILLYNDLAQRASKGDTPYLRFLLAYIYYQMDQRDLARIAIAAAEKALG